MSAPTYAIMMMQTLPSRQKITHSKGHWYLIREDDLMKAKQKK
jgi:hypothetical protein